MTFPNREGQQIRRLQADSRGSQRLPRKAMGNRFNQLGKIGSRQRGEECGVLHRVCQIFFYGPHVLDRFLPSFASSGKFI
jgi:hypothetical protein